VGSFGGKKFGGKQWKISHYTFKQWETPFFPLSFSHIYLQWETSGKT